MTEGFSTGVSKIASIRMYGGLVGRGMFEKGPVMSVSLIYLVTLEYISTFPYLHPATYRPVRISRKWLFLINYYTTSIVSIVRLQISSADHKHNSVQHKCSLRSILCLELLHKAHCKQGWYNDWMYTFSCVVSTELNRWATNWSCLLNQTNQQLYFKHLHNNLSFTESVVLESQNTWP